MIAPGRELRAGQRMLALGARPWLMGIVNATPDSFSDAGMHDSLCAARGARALAAVRGSRPD